MPVTIIGDRCHSRRGRRTHDQGTQRQSDSCMSLKARRALSASLGAAEIAFRRACAVQSSTMCRRARVAPCVHSAIANRNNAGQEYHHMSALGKCGSVRSHPDRSLGTFGNPSHVVGQPFFLIPRNAFGKIQFLIANQRRGLPVPLPPVVLINMIKDGLACPRPSSPAAGRNGCSH
jgi:hypothetical protein